MTLAVTLDIAGDAIIYEKDSVWNVVFITDEDHTIKVYSNGSTKPDIELADMNRPLAMYLNPVRPVSLNRGRGKGFASILNLNDSDLHGLDANGRSNLNIKPNPSNGRQYVHVRVPVGTLGGEAMVPDYWIAEHPNGSANAHGHEVAKIARLTFQLNDGGKIAIHLKDENGPVLKSWVESKAGDIHLLFDNDCHSSGNRSDFLNYYDWVTDKSVFPLGNKRFIAGKLHSSFTKGTSLEPKMMGRDGNCDPVVVDPPPGP